MLRIAFVDRVNGRDAPRAPSRSLAVTGTPTASGAQIPVPSTGGVILSVDDGDSSALIAIGTSPDPTAAGAIFVAPGAPVSVAGVAAGSRIGAVIGAPTTAVTKTSLGLGSVDNTSDATKAAPGNAVGDALADKGRRPKPLTDARVTARAGDDGQPVSGIAHLGDGFRGDFVQCVGDPDPFIGIADKFQANDGSWWVRDQACHLAGAATPDPAPQSWYADRPNPPRIDRTIGRYFGGLAAEQAYGASQGFELPNYRRLHTWLGGWKDQDGVNRSAPGYYLEEGAGLLWVSRNGAGAIVGASRQSDRYTGLGYRLWKSGETVAVGAKRYWASKFYVATTPGTSGDAGPTHSSGTGSDGAVSWQYVDHAPGATIGVSAVAVSDVVEPNGVAWAFYNELQRDYDGGTGFAREVAVKNKGDNVHNNPYNKFPGGSTIGDWFAGGGDASLGAPTAPSTAAILIGKNGHTWNKGIVFTDDAISSVGANGMVAVALAKDHRIAWFTPESYATGEGAVGAFIDASVTQTGRKSGISLEDDAVRVKARAGFIASFENGAGDAAPSYLRFISGSGAQVEIRADGSGANTDLLLTPKGTGLVRFGTLSTDATNMSAFLAARAIKIRQGDGTILYVPCTLNPW